MLFKDMFPVNTQQEAANLSKMIAIASMGHNGQFDKGGNPYILHPLHVMRDVQNGTEGNFIVMQVAIGHDLFEDTAVTPVMLQMQGISEFVIEAIDLLTKKQGQTYFDMIKAIVKNPLATLVKRYDLMHNSDLRRLKGITEKDRERAAKYMQAYYYLTFGEGLDENS